MPDRPTLTLRTQPGPDCVGPGEQRVHYLVRNDIDAPHTCRTAGDRGPVCPSERFRIECRTLIAHFASHPKHLTHHALTWSGAQNGVVTRPDQQKPGQRRRGWVAPGSRTPSGPDPSSGSVGRYGFVAMAADARRTRLRDHRSARIFAKSAGWARCGKCPLWGSTVISTDGRCVLSQLSYVGSSTLPAT